MQFEFGTYEDPKRVGGYVGWINTNKQIVWIDTDGNFSAVFDYPDQEMSKEDLYEMYKVKIKEEE